MPLLFAVTLFVSAFLLFLVQPMIGKMILPRLGGTPAVWNTCMVFFQGVLLAGYAYTHSVTTWLPTRRQLLLQCGVLLLPLLFLPFAVGNWTPPTESNPVFAVLLLLLLIVGIPFMVVATSAPLLQKWFSHTGHRSARDPYFLYGASNLGSMLALLAYPTLIEPQLPVPAQTAFWAWSYALFIVLMLACAAVVWFAPRTAELVALSPAAEPAAAPPPVTPASEAVSVRPGRKSWRGRKAVQQLKAPPTKPSSEAPPDEVTPLRRLRWIGLAAVPSSLMLGVTTYLTTDIAAIPLFWVVPLALYLLSFIVVFLRWPAEWAQASQPVVVILQPLVFVASMIVLPLILGYIAEDKWSPVVGLAVGLGLIALLLVLTALLRRGGVLVLQPLYLFALALINLSDVSASHALNFGVNLMVFFLTALLCHGELACDRPSTRYLTEFYLWMSVGGVLGGLFNALLAPMVFYRYLEYMLVVALSCLLRPRTRLLAQLFRRDTELPPDKPEDYALDVGYAACLALFAFALLRLSMAEALWGEAETFHASLYSSFNEWGWFGQPEPGKAEAHFTHVWAAAGWLSVAVVAGVPLLLCLIFSGRPLRFGLCAFGFFLANALYAMAHEKAVFNPDGTLKKEGIVYLHRSFYGTQRVRASTEVRYGLPEEALEAARAEHVPPTVLAKLAPLKDVSFKNTTLLSKLLHQALTPDEYARYEEILLKHSRQVYEYNVLIHGGIDHGREFRDPAKRARPISYFHPTGPIGQVFTAFSAQEKPQPFGVIGLGIGTLAGYAREGQHAVFYEIDPAVKRLSLPPDGEEPYFHYLHDAIVKRKAKVEVVLGDGRLRLEEAPPNYYQILVMDAFSSDAIPIHLLTVEALDLYLRKVTDGGILIFNVTNRYVDLPPELGELAAMRGLRCYHHADWSENITAKFSSDWVIMVKPRTERKAIAVEAAGLLGAAPTLPLAGAVPWAAVSRWPEANVPPLLLKLDFKHNWLPCKRRHAPAWTDDYSNLLRALTW